MTAVQLATGLPTPRCVQHAVHEVLSDVAS